MSYQLPCNKINMKIFSQHWHQWLVIYFTFKRSFYYKSVKRQKLTAGITPGPIRCSAKMRKKLLQNVTWKTWWGKSMYYVLLLKYVCKSIILLHKKWFGGDWVKILTINSKFKVLKYTIVHSMIGFATKVWILHLPQAINM